MVAQWCNAHGLASMGHPPGNYEPTAVDMYGDRVQNLTATPRSR
ncbi:MAG: hypothetical protein ACLR8Y_11585 [Alistipes indistinctus]